MLKLLSVKRSCMQARRGAHALISHCYATHAQRVPCELRGTIPLLVSDYMNLQQRLLKRNSDKNNNPINVGALDNTLLAAIKEGFGSVVNTTEASLDDNSKVKFIQPGSYSALDKKLDVLLNENARFRSDLDSVTGDLARRESDLASVTGDLARREIDLALLKSNLALLKCDLASVRGDLASVRGDLAIVKDDLAICIRGKTEISSYEILSAGHQLEIALRANVRGNTASSTQLSEFLNRHRLKRNEVAHFINLLPALKWGPDQETPPAQKGGVAEDEWKSQKPRYELLFNVFFGMDQATVEKWLGFEKLIRRKLHVEQVLEDHATFSRHFITTNEFYEKFDQWSTALERLSSHFDTAGTCHLSSEEQQDLLQQVTNAAKAIRALKHAANKTISAAIKSSRGLHKRLIEQAHKDSDKVQKDTTNQITRQNEELQNDWEIFEARQKKRGLWDEIVKVLAGNESEAEEKNPQNEGERSEAQQEKRGL